MIRVLMLALVAMVLTTMATADDFDAALAAANAKNNGAKTYQVQAAGTVTVAPAPAASAPAPVPTAAPQPAPAPTNNGCTALGNEFTGYTNGRFYFRRDVVDKWLPSGATVYIRSNSTGTAACARAPRCEKCQQSRNFRDEQGSQWHDFATSLEKWSDGNEYYVADCPGNVGDGVSLELNAVGLRDDGRRVYFPDHRPGTRQYAGVFGHLEDQGALFRFALPPQTAAK